jgi:acyl carrier protein
MAAALGSRELARLGRLGSIPLETGEALSLFDAAAAVEESLLIPAHLDLAAVRGGTGGHLARRPGPGPAAGSTTGPDDPGFAARLSRLSPPRRAEPVLTLVRENLAVVCGFAGAAEIGPDRPFQELGIESLAAIELRDRLAAVTGVTLSATAVFDHPTPRILAAALLAAMGLDETSAADRLLAGIQALESSFAEVGTDTQAGPVVYEQVAARLEGLRRAWAARNGGAGPDGGFEDLSEVSDTEMFDLLDNELGLTQGDPN